MKVKVLISLLILVACNLVYANEHSYSNVADRHADSALDQEAVRYARMQGECLVGLKELNFKKKENFDPVAEWTNFRTTSLLQQHSPCEVLIMMEVARSILNSEEQGE